GRAQKLLAHAPGNAHHGDFHSATSRSIEGTARDIAAPAAVRKASRRQNPRCTAKPALRMPALAPCIQCVRAF
ncbi:MAG: hypothetical protein WDN31_00620, partial [Hyphomicrobium sp.]